jgi:RNA polymerase-binding protein DksA
MLTAQKLNDYRMRLRSMRTRLDDRAASIAPRRDGEAGDGFSETPVDFADRARQQTVVNESLGVAENEARLAKEIDAALERIDAGTYGICEGCGACIAANRLNAMPYAKLCIRCERRVEKNG